MTAEVIEKTFPVSGQPRLALTNIRGAMVVAVGTEDAIHVLAVKHLESGDDENTNIRLEQMDDGNIHVETSFKSIAGFFSGKKPCKVDYTVTVPSGSSLNISGVSSSCQISGYLGNIKIKTVSGPISLSDISGVFDIEVVSGDISIENMEGSLSFSTVSGDLSIRESMLTQIRGATVSGDVAAQTPLNEGPYEFRSVSGEVSLSIPEGNGCVVRTSSLSGRLRTNLKTHRTRHNGKDKEVELDGGGALVRFSSISGGIQVDTSGEAFREETSSGEGAVQEEDPERLEILNLIETGQISVEEGIERLKSL